MEHPAEFIRDEMKARGWKSLSDIVLAADGTVGNLASLEIYMASQEPGVMMGYDLRRLLSKAFGTSQKFWANLHKQWCDSLTPTPPQ